MNAATEKMTNLEWLTQIGLKAIEYSADPKSTGEKGPSWEDRCGAIASIECPACKAYCELLVWGDYRDNTEAFKILCSYIAKILHYAAEEKTQRQKFNLEAFCLKLAKMAVFYNLRPRLKNERTAQGQLNFFGITEVNADTYGKRYKYLSYMAENILEGFMEEIDFYVDEYRKELTRSRR